MKRIGARIGFGVVCVAALVFAPYMTSSAGEGEFGRETSEADTAELAALKRGELLHPTFDELSSMPGFESGGFRDGSDDLEFYWHGPLPAAAEESIARAEARGQTVSITSTPYSYDEIRELSLRLDLAIAADDHDLGITEHHEILNEIRVGPIELAEAYEVWAVNVAEGDAPVDRSNPYPLWFPDPAEPGSMLSFYLKTTGYRGDRG